MHVDELSKPEAIRFIWKTLNAEARGKITATQALGAILHACMRAMGDPRPDPEPCGACQADAARTAQGER